MKFVFASYVYTNEYDEPTKWLNRIKAYIGILEALSSNNEVISIEQINYEGDYQHNGVYYHFKRYSKWGRLFPFKLHRFIKSQNPDVVVIQSLHFPLQVIQLRLALGFKTKIIIQNHAEKPFKGIKKYAQQLAYYFTDAYLFASDDLGAEWVKAGNLVSTEKIHEVMEISSVFAPMDKASAKKHTGITAGNPIFLWVGRLNKNKDPLTVVKAFLKYAEVHTTARLYMIYQTDELLPDTVTLLNHSEQKDNVVLVGEIHHNLLGYWYNSVDIILSGSHYEGSGTAICEAMSCGCMPIVTNIPSFRMITNQAKCGFLYEAGNEAALLSILLQLEHEDVLSKQSLSLAYYIKNLSFEAIANRIEDVANTIPA